MSSLNKNIIDELRVEYCFDSNSAIAGVSGSETYFDGQALDLFEMRAGSCFFAVELFSGVADEENIALTALVMHSDDGETFEDTLLTVTDGIIHLGPSDPAERSLLKIPVDLETDGLKRYIRLTLYPVLSAEADDYCVFSAVAVFGYGPRPADRLTDWVAPT